MSAIYLTVNSCRKSVELHDKRHREIAALILKVQKIDEAEQAILSPANNRKRKTKKSDALAEFRSSSALDNIIEEGEWADSSTLNDDELEVETPGSVYSKENCPPKKSSKAERKRAKHSKLVQIVTPELMNMVDIVLHPENHLIDEKEQKPGDESTAALSHKIIEENIAFNTNCFLASSVRQSVHAKKLLKANGVGKTPSPQSAQDDPEITLILEQLGISSTPGHSSRERNALIKHLRNAIRDDTEKVENENRDTMMRMAGYWRYVNRKTYNVMVRNNEIWDWVTGQKLEEIGEEEEEDESDTEEELDTDAYSWDDMSTLATPFSGSGTPVNELEDYSADYELRGLRTLRLVDDSGRLDAKLNQELYGRDGDGMPTPKASQSPIDTPERRSRITDSKHKTPNSPPRTLFFSGTKDSRHLRPTSISTLKNNEPFEFMPPTPSTPAPADKAFSAPHHDPSNRYSPLAKLNGSLNQNLGRTTKTLKVAVPAVLSAKDTNAEWTTVKGKGAGAGKTSYAGALKKKSS